MSPSTAHNQHELRDLPVKELLLDPLNPRLPAELQSNQDQLTLLRHIADSFNAIEVARSIAQYGYFVSEPLIAVWEDGQHIVVEGNRRLVALKILNDPSLAAGLVEEVEYQQLAESQAVPDRVPVVIASDRRDVAPIIGYRHISGIQPWDSFAKARFIATLVDDGMAMDVVAAIVGEPLRLVAQHYRNHQIVLQARNDLKINTAAIESEFGVFTHAMAQAGIRDHIGAPTPSRVERGMKPIPADKADEAVELFSWLAGKRKVINDSRQVRQLSRVLESPAGVEALRQTRNLEEAELSAGGPRTRLMTLLTRANSNLALAQNAIADYVEDPDVIEILDQIREKLESMTPGQRHA